MELIENFLSNLSFNEGLAKNTQENYERDLKQMLSYLEANSLDILNVDTEDLRQYIFKLSNKYSNRTIARHISSIKHFYDFLQIEKIITHNPSTKLEQKKIEQTLPKFFEENAIEKILNEAKKDTSNYGIKFYCMLELLYASGMRVSELVQLQLANLDREFIPNSSNEYTIKPYLNIIGKGGKNRIIPISNSAVVALEKYLKLRQQLLEGQDSKWLFTTKVIFTKNNNNSKSTKNIRKDDFTKRQVFARYLKEIGAKVGVDITKLSPHSIRHSVATMMLKNGADLRFIQEFLGHSDIGTTQIYTHLNDSYKKETIKKYHPFRNKK